MGLGRWAVGAGAGQVGAGQRMGNRRRALGAMLAAEPQRTARWLAGEADRWARRHASGQLGASRDETSPGGASRDGSAEPDPVQLWWAERAAGTARLLSGIDALRGAGKARDSGETHGTRGGQDGTRGGQDGARGGQETESVSAAD